MVPSVTGIIRAAGLMGPWTPPDWYMTRGKAIHAAIEYYEQGDLDEAVMDAVILPYLEAWRAFKAATGLEVTEMERVIVHPVYRYAGRVDIIGTLNNRKVLIDIKTGGPESWHGLQVAAYNEVAKCDQVYTVYLQEDGKWKQEKYTDRRAIYTFLAALTIYNFKKSNKIT